MKKVAIIAGIIALIVAGVLLLKRAGESDSGEGTASKKVEQSHGLSGEIEVEDETREAAQSRLKDSIGKRHPWVPDDASENLTAGGIKVEVAFESKVSSELQRAILHDLNLIFGHLESHEYLDARGAPEMLINGALQQPDRFLKFTEKGRFFPRELTGKIGFMKGEKMVFPDDVIQAYEEAWSRKTANEEKYGSLLTAIDKLNGLAGNPVQNPRDWFFISADAQTAGVEMPDITKEQFAESFGGYRYRQPSLLDVFDGVEWSPDLAGKLIARLYVFEPEGAISNSMPPLIYTDGSWRFFITQPPT
jgi:hypothetical protein